MSRGWSDTIGAVSRVRIEIPPRGPRPALTFPSGLLQPPRGTADPGQDPPLPPARLDPLLIVTRPIVPAAFRKLDAIASLMGPLSPAQAMRRNLTMQWLQQTTARPGRRR
jgi:hypothetical protein